ncbi:hypothetical protein ACVWZK_008416 [Bradyrhizobium sp. GM0.4]
MLFFPRFNTAFAAVFHQGPPGGSTRMTSAPWSARSMAARGPGRYWPKSTTRQPANGPPERIRDAVIELPYVKLWFQAHRPVYKIGGVRQRLCFSSSSLSGWLAIGSRRLGNLETSRDDQRELCDPADETRGRRTDNVQSLYSTPLFVHDSFRSPPVISTPLPLPRASIHMQSLFAALVVQLGPPSTSSRSAS